MNANGLRLIGTLVVCLMTFNCVAQGPFGEFPSVRKPLDLLRIDPIREELKLTAAQIKELENLRSEVAAAHKEIAIRTVVSQAKKDHPNLQTADKVPANIPDKKRPNANLAVEELSQLDLRVDESISKILTRVQLDRLEQLKVQISLLQKGVAILLVEENKSLHESLALSDDEREKAKQAHHEFEKDYGKQARELYATMLMESLQNAMTKEQYKKLNEAMGTKAEFFPQ